VQPPLRLSNIPAGKHNDVNSGNAYTCMRHKHYLYSQYLGLYCSEWVIAE